MRTIRPRRVMLADTDGGAELGGTLDRSRATLLVVLTGLSVVLGGGDSSPLINMAIELVGVALLFTVLATPAADARLGPLALATLALVCAIPLLQLVPLPVAWWRAMPGHALPFAIQEAADALPAPHRWSLDPDGTRRAGLFLIPGLAAFLAGARAGPEERRRLVLLLIGLTVASALLGVVQVGSGAGYLRPTSHEGSSVGFFTNRNHQADLLLIGMPLVAALGAERFLSRSNLLLEVAAILLLGLCEITTTSRMGTTLIAPVMIASLAILLAGRPRSAWIAMGVGALLVAVAGLLALANPVVQATLTRFRDVGEDSRYAFWSGTVFAIHQYWPWGSGLGTFRPVYASAEDLDQVSEFYANHAHNDYLELLLECGVAGALAMLAYAALLASKVRAAARGRGWPLRAAALVVILLLLIHSTVDYPLRTYGLLVVFAIANGLLLRPLDRFAVMGERVALPRGTVVPLDAAR